MSNIPHQAIIDIKIQCYMHQRNNLGQIDGPSVGGKPQYGKMFTIKADSLDKLQQQVEIFYETLLEKIESCQSIPETK